MISQAVKHLYSTRFHEAWKVALQSNCLTKWLRAAEQVDLSYMNWASGPHTRQKFIDDFVGWLKVNPAAVKKLQILLKHDLQL